MSRVYLLRHATHGLVDRALAGRMPGVHLSDEGSREADAVAALLASRAIGRILCSPRERCRETAAPLAARTGVAVEIETALDEIDCGRWTGRELETLTEDPAWPSWNAERETSRMPEGESAAEVRERAMALLQRLAGEENGVTVLVTHSDVIKTIVLTVVGTSLNNHGSVAVDPASVTTLDLWPGGGKVVRLNESADP